MRKVGPKDAAEGRTQKRTEDGDENRPIARPQRDEERPWVKR